ncbi:hypothetical protein BAUCODRAFT_180484 [Baudoinia panamericana UAMH 10762]|uniref:U1-C C2H2-type zinc finger domain-containing protein n=1 Tax=Baudoinia panamericana (strain UAMH 10762) TaxID=717646 RepID=M2M105_BAUPA|nr:uncharacterized protein BAUCODRAFT_180484 [Baudoinia panamericana UAMH 10762]EMD00713.1 hypothetical protein BAUCODRAFT_180484 [Baudoinia panamericana UAMH 10762]
MAEYWKSTPSYWCKFCQVYVKDTGIERKAHESSGRHQGAIQRNLRELAKGKARDERDKQRAKDEVARLNGLVGGKSSAASKPAISGFQDLGRQTAAPRSALDPAAQRKAHAEQLLALGVQLPEDLKREVTGVGEWQTVSERVIETELTPVMSADVKKQEDDEKDDVKPEAIGRGVRKRTADDDTEDAVSKRRPWGSSMKSYPGGGGTADNANLDELLSGITKKQPDVKEEENADGVALKREESATETPLASVPDASGPAVAVKQEEAENVPAVVFKKRKVKR